MDDPIAIAVVVLLNATIGFVQESRAEASLEALKKMLVTTAMVRRDGRNVDAAELVVGDVVEVEAGDRVPADGRLLSSSGLEVQGVLAYRRGAAGGQVRDSQGGSGRAAGRPNHRRVHEYDRHVHQRWSESIARCATEGGC